MSDRRERGMSLSLSLVSGGREAGWVGGKIRNGSGRGGGQERLYLPLRTFYGVPTAVVKRFPGLKWLGGQEADATTSTRGSSPLHSLEIT
jgi:hypothetical protein